MEKTNENQSLITILLKYSSKENYNPDLNFNSITYCKNRRLLYLWKFPYLQNKGGRMAEPA